MKNLSLYFGLLFFVSGYSQIIQFTCPQLKSFLVNANPNTSKAGIGWANSGSVFTSTGFWPINFVKIDTNNNGEIEVSEAQLITTLWIGGNSLTNLNGLEYFTNLKILNIAQNPELTTFNFPMMSQLEYLSFFNCNISSINLVNYPMLTDLVCANNGITTINLNSNPALKALYINNNQLTTLDLSSNTNLIYLGIKNNNISTLNIKNGAQQLFVVNLYMLADAWANNPLSAICLDSNEVQNVQAHLTSNNYNLGNIVFNTTATCMLNTNGFSISTISISPNPSSGMFEIILPEIATCSIKVFNVLGSIVQQFEFKNQDKFMADLSALQKGVYIMNITNQKQQTFQQKVVLK